jgi:hypothetical protein
MHSIFKPRLTVCDFFDFHSPGGTGRLFAAQLAAGLQTSRHYRVIPAGEWCRCPPGQERLFNAPWAAQAAKQAGADIVVIGRLCDPTVSEWTFDVRMLETGSGEVLFKTPAVTVGSLVKRLDSRRVAARLKTRQGSIEARIVEVRGRAIHLDAGIAAGLAPKDTVQVNRILEIVRDPYYSDAADGQALGRMTANLGEAEILAAGTQTSLAHYLGVRSPRVGDLAVLARDLSYPCTPCAVRKVRAT